MPKTVLSLGKGSFAIIKAVKKITKPEDISVSDWLKKITTVATELVRGAAFVAPPVSRDEYPAAQRFMVGVLDTLADRTQGVHNENIAQVVGLPASDVISIRLGLNSQVYGGDYAFRVNELSRQVSIKLALEAHRRQVGGVSIAANQLTIVS